MMHMYGMDPNQNCNGMLLYYICNYPEDELMNVICDRARDCSSMPLKTVQINTSLWRSLIFKLGLREVFFDVM